MPDSERAHEESWTEERAERRLRSLELFGMRFGLDRMRRMMTALGSPERRFQTIHVLGTNGKSSTTRMIAAILERHGLRTGVYISPHLISYRERLLIGGREIDQQAFAAAVARASWASERVNRTLDEDDHITQFELLTAAALWEMAEQEVEVAVVEAGLGGRYDATSVIDARVMVLTNVGLEHTRWLGPTIRDIAEEKLAVVPAGGTLVLGEDLDAAAADVAERVAGERDATILRPGRLEGKISVLARGEFQRRNFALARSAAGAYLQRSGVALDERAVAAAAAETFVDGRLQIVDEHPLTIIDGAHNPHAVSALASELPTLAGERPVALVLGVLEDKDAAAMLALLLPLCERAWFTLPPSSRALSPAALESLARQLHFDAVARTPQPSRALAQAREWALEHDGVVLAAGSVYLAGELLGEFERSEASGARGWSAAR